MIGNKIQGCDKVLFVPVSTKELKTGAATVTRKLAEVIEASFGDGEDQVIRQIGAGALNISVKGVATARLNLIRPKMSVVEDLLIRPVWRNVTDIHGKEVSTVELETVYVLRKDD